MTYVEGLSQINRLKRVQIYVSVFVFSLSSPKLVYEKKELCRGDAKVLAAIFVPRPHKLLDTAWSSDSQLHFIDSNQVRFRSDL